MIHVLFRDALFIALLTFVAMVVWMLPHLNPPTQQDEIVAPGSIIVTIFWPEGNTDVDLWVDGPGEPVPVGFKNKSGKIWNLLRDDLGNYSDATKLNREYATTRGAPAGQYRINLHCYRCPEVPVPVVVEVRLRTDAGGVVEIGTREVILRETGEEKTAFAFRLSADETLDTTSVSRLFQSLINVGRRT